MFKSYKQYVFSDLECDFFTLGIASLEMLLSNDPPLGTWSIKVIYNDSKAYTNTFSVEEYGIITILKGLEGRAILKPFLISFKGRIFFRNIGSLLNSKMKK